MTAVFRIELNADWDRDYNTGQPHPAPTRFTRSFWLDPLEVCVGYWLRAEKLPAGVSIQINHQHICDLEHIGAINIEVTDAVWLEKNIITLSMKYPTSNLPFSGLILEAIPCE